MGREQGRGGEGRTRPEGLPLPGVSGGEEPRAREVGGITYEINRMVGRYDNWFTRVLSAPGLWMQNFTTNEPDDSMIEVGIAAVQAVLPEQEGADLW